MNYIKYFALSTSILFFLSCNNSTETETDKVEQKTEKKEVMEKHEKSNLKTILDEKKAAFELKADDNKKKVYKNGIDAVSNSGILKSAIQVGDKAPNFTLNNAQGEPIMLEEYLQRGMVVLTWYRGGWCPYCNLTLHQLQLELPNFKENRANLIALTPELPDLSIETTEKHSLQYEVLSDLENNVAKEYGVAFKLDDKVAEMYNKSFGLNEYNGDDSNVLPLAATYIINQDGIVVYAFLDADYRNRAEPSDLTEFLKNYKN